MKWLKLLAFVLFVFILVFFGLVTILLGPVNKDNPQTVTVTITKGASRSEIANQLFEAGLTKNKGAMYLYLQFRKANVISGTYEFSTDKSASIIAETLIFGRVKTEKITLLEGWRVKDYEKYLVEEKKMSQFVGLTSYAQELEGYLFPDTYQIPVDATNESFVNLLKDNFAKRTKDLEVTPDALILASIVEREAIGDSERSAIAGVYANRMKIGMRLQADPTIQYAKGNWAAVALSEYQSVISPYNTYLNDGLPPGPICNPGLKSIIAALNPEKHDYYFFFHAKGQTFFSKTYAEHAAKVRANF